MNFDAGKNGSYQKYFGKKHKMMRKAIREFVSKKVKPDINDWEEQGAVHRRRNIRDHERDYFKIYPVNHIMLRDYGNARLLALFAFHIIRFSIKLKVRLPAGFGAWNAPYRYHLELYG